MKCQVNHKVCQHSSLKKCKFALREVFSKIRKGATISEVIAVLRQLSMQNKAAFLVLRAAEQTIHNFKNVVAQKRCKIVDPSQGKIQILLGRAAGLMRIQLRAKGSTSAIQKHRVNINVVITNEIVEESDGSKS